MQEPIESTQDCWRCASTGDSKVYKKSHSSSQLYCCHIFDYSEHCGEDEFSICTSDIEYSDNKIKHYLFCPSADECGKTKFKVNEEQITKIATDHISPFEGCIMKIKNKGHRSESIGLFNIYSSEGSIYY